MRIKLKFKPNNNKFNFENYDVVNSYINACIGKNNKYHGKQSLYSISNLAGGIIKNNGENYLTFTNGAFIIISSNDENFISKIIMGAFMNDKIIDKLNNVLIFDGVEHISEKLYGGYNYFITLSPIILRKKINKENYHFVTPKDGKKTFEKFITNNTKLKLKQFNENLNVDNLKIELVDKFVTKKQLLKNITNIATHCTLKIYSNKNIAEIIYNIGLGKSTGYGFGTIYKTENIKMYKPIRNEKIKQKLKIIS